VARLAIPTAQALALVMRNGAKLEAVAVNTHRHMAKHATSAEFRERCEAVLADEIRHTQMQHELADRLYDGPLPISEAIQTAARQSQRFNDDPVWHLVALSLIERVFAARMKVFARYARNAGYRFMFAPLIDAAADEQRHVVLVNDMLRALPDRQLAATKVEDAARWLSAIEATDRSGFIPTDHLIARMSDALQGDLR